MNIFSIMIISSEIISLEKMQIFSLVVVVKKMLSGE